MRKDALVMYVDTPEVVYVLLYRNDSNDPIDYKNVLLLMTQSFRVNKSIVVQSTTISQTTSTQNTSIIQNSSSTTSTINQEF